MGVFSDDKREITCIYNGNDSGDKQTVAYLSAAEKKVLSIDITKQKLTGTQWAELATRLNKNINQLINSDKIEGDIENYDDDDCLTILRENPEALNGAIVFTKGSAEQISNSSKVLSFLDANSEDIEKPYKKHKE